MQRTSNVSIPEAMKNQSEIVNINIWYCQTVCDKIILKTFRLLKVKERGESWMLKASLIIEIKWL